MNKLKVDKNQCIGCGTCVSLYPDLFKIGADGKAQIVDGIEDIDESKIRKIVTSCPMVAIKKSSE